jgi:hypothetical protein
MVLIYRAGWQLFKVRALMLLSLVAVGVCVWFGIDLARTYGTEPGDGGELAPLGQRLLVAAAVILLGVGFAAGMALYGRCYTARIEFDPDSNKYHLYTVGFLGSPEHVMDAKTVRNSRRHSGRFQGRIEVDAPWTTVRMAGWRLPLIVDGQGVVLDEKLMSAFFAG